MFGFRVGFVRVARLELPHQLRVVRDGVERVHLEPRQLVLQLRLLHLLVLHAEPHVLRLLGRVGRALLYGHLLAQVGHHRVLHLLRIDQRALQLRLDRRHLGLRLGLGLGLG